MDLIEQLKDPKLAQPNGIYIRYFPEKFEILARAGSAKCLLLQANGDWTEPLTNIDKSVNADWVYILKPDYQPEPEYVDFEITEFGGWCGVLVNSDEAILHNQRFTHLHCLPSLPGFAGFYYDDLNFIARFEEVATRISDGKNVIVRFRKTEQ